MAAERDIRDKRPWETHFQWRGRVARLDADERVRSEPIVPIEAQRHGDYRDTDVMHIETQTIAVTKRNRFYTPFDDLHHRGVISVEQRDAVDEIQDVAAMVQSAVSVRCASLEARVDNAGGARDVLVERLGRVQLEVAYTRWRQALPVPRQMILDMVLQPGPLKAKAVRHGMGWPKARKWLLRALDRWIEIRDKVLDEVDQKDLDAAHQRLSGSAGR